ncbi:MAG: hypothetical protein LBH25_13080 [Fibromonadaceae bacterium]|jgi:hypothetical protein|nr:hypothetical protein [Fibromonadaceae bacterium]
MNLKQLVNKAKNKNNFVDLKAYIKFCDEYLNYICDNLQAIIISQNESHYRFLQYKKEGNFQITRPINSNLMYSAKDFLKVSKEFLKILQNIKTIDKIFIDKFLYNKLTEKLTPHIAIFLNDVQRKNTRHENEYGINATFLPEHFKGYTIKLNPLDGVYYCDIRPNMQTENILKDYIKTFDKLLIDDIWKFL